MEAAAPQRELSGEKAQRIIEAMRASVGVRGATASTFHHVAREAGVSRGLLHYYFGTKERLLAEVVRHDCDVRMQLISDSLATVSGPDELLNGLVAQLRATIAETPEFFAILFELHTLGAHNPDIAAELVQLHQRVRTHLGRELARARDAGVVGLTAEPEVVGEVLFSLADGLGMRMLAEPERDFEPALAAAGLAARALVVSP